MAAPSPRRGHIAETREQAADEFFPSYAAMMNAIGRERGWSEVRRPDFDALRTLHGALIVGSVEDVVEKILSSTRSSGTTAFWRR